MNHEPYWTPCSDYSFCNGWETCQFGECIRGLGPCMGAGLECNEANEVCTGERAHAGWNWVDNQIELTANEPTYWSVLTGRPKNVSPFTILDPGDPPGRLDPKRMPERVL
ncbi:MAG: hypothetical protein KJ749_12695, partial [Planctomycetes bacterium]|nr:hypothetical protein [Planctomycetota bacterium]